MKPADGKTIWLLNLVPETRFGRLICAGLIIVFGVGLYAIADHLTEPGAYAAVTWNIALFFVFAIAYIVPVFHYITRRTQQALDTLRPFLPDDDTHACLVGQIDHKPLRWHLRVGFMAVGLWLLQSWLLAGSFAVMWRSVTHNLAGFLMSIGPLPVWLTMNTAMSALFYNALLFRRLARDMDVSILEPDSFLPIGNMAVASTLVVLGAVGLLSIMWLDGPISWWTTVPSLLILLPLVAALLLLPILPVHNRLKAQRLAVLTDAQVAVRESHRDGHGSVADKAAALAWRQEIARLPTWPFDVPAVIRLISYAVIVPLTWAGAALIEILVNMIID